MASATADGCALLPSTTCTTLQNLVLIRYRSGEHHVSSGASLRSVSSTSRALIRLLAGLSQTTRHPAACKCDHCRCCFQGKRERGNPNCKRSKRRPKRRPEDPARFIARLHVCCQARFPVLCQTWKFSCARLTNNDLSAMVRHCTR
jgi:hypothetical protein